MEVVGGGAALSVKILLGSKARRNDLRGINDLHVAVLVLTVELLGRWVHSGLVVAQLQESLHSTRRVLGTLSVVSVRQAEYETGSLQPFALSGSNELVDDTLCVVADKSALASLLPEMTHAKSPN